MWRNFPKKFDWNCLFQSAIWTAWTTPKFFIWTQDTTLYSYFIVFFTEKIHLWKNTSTLNEHKMNIFKIRTQKHVSHEWLIFEKICLNADPLCPSTNCTWTNIGRPILLLLTFPRTAAKGRTRSNSATHHGECFLHETNKTEFVSIRGFFCERDVVLFASANKSEINYDMWKYEIHWCLLMKLDQRTPFRL